MAANHSRNEKVEGLSNEEIEQFAATMMRLLKQHQGTEGETSDLQGFYTGLRNFYKETQTRRNEAESMNRDFDHQQSNFGLKTDYGQKQQEHTDGKLKKEKNHKDREEKLQRSQLSADQRNKTQTKEKVKHKKNLNRNFTKPPQEDKDHNVPFSHTDSSSKTEHMNNSIQSHKADHTEKMIYFLEQVNKCGRLLKETVFYVFCLIIMLGICTFKFLWNVVIFLLKLIIILILWLSIKLFLLAKMLKHKFKIMEVAKSWMSVISDIFHLVTGINIKRIFQRSTEPSQTFDDVDNSTPIALPETSEGAIAHLLAQNENRPYRTLCVSKKPEDAEVKINYRKLALLVHPDKCNHPKSDDAFKVLDSAFKKISDPQKRLEMEETEKQREFSEKFCEDFQKMFEELVSTISCTSCNGKHKRNLMKERNFFEARYCSECNKNHAAADGDVWAESGIFGLGWTCFVCMDGEIYELTEWAKCQNLCGTIPVNSHRVHCRLGNQNGHKSSRSSRYHTSQTEMNGSKRKKSKKGRKAR